MPSASCVCAVLGVSAGEGAVEDVVLGRPLLGRSDSDRVIIPTMDVEITANSGNPAE